MVTRFSVFVLVFAMACGGSTPPPAAPAPAPTPAPEPVVAPAPVDNAIVVGNHFTFASTVLGEDRTYIVHTPPGYEVGSARYPVLYLLDGPGHFLHTVGLIQFLASQNRMPHMIVVAVANTDRTRDYTPTPIERLPTSGGADKFLAFLATELVPRIEQEYRTAPYRMLVGHSFGGLCAIHALNTQPDLFDALVSISPSLWWDETLPERQSVERFAATPELAGFLYVTVGGEPERMMTSNRAYAAMLRKRAPKGLRWHYEEMEREDHGSIPHRATYRAFELLFEGWRAPETITTLGELEAHYRGLSERFKFEIKVPEEHLNLIGYGLMGQDKLDAAIAVFQRNTELYPNSANVYDSLAEALEKKGATALALKNYENAVETARKNADPRLPLFETRLADARKRNGAPPK